MGRTCSSCCGGCTLPPTIECKVEGTIFSWDIKGATPTSQSSDAAFLFQPVQFVYVNLDPVWNGPGMGLKPSDYWSANNSYQIIIDDEGNSSGSFDFADLIIRRWGYHWQIIAKNKCGTATCIKNCTFEWGAWIRENVDDLCLGFKGGCAQGTYSSSGYDPTYHYSAVRNDMYKLEWFVYFGNNIYTSSTTTPMDDATLLKMAEGILINGKKYPGGEIKIMPPPGFDTTKISTQTVVPIKGIYNYVDIDRCDLEDVYEITYEGRNYCGAPWTNAYFGEGMSFHIVTFYPTCVDKYKKVNTYLNFLADGFVQERNNFTDYRTFNPADLWNIPKDLHNTKFPKDYSYYEVSGLSNFNFDETYDIVCVAPCDCSKSTQTPTGLWWGSVDKTDCKLITALDYEEIPFTLNPLYGGGNYFPFGGDPNINLYHFTNRNFKADNLALISHTDIILSGCDGKLPGIVKVKSLGGYTQLNSFFWEYAYTMSGYEWTGIPFVVLGPGGHILEVRILVLEYNILGWPKTANGFSGVYWTNRDGAPVVTDTSVLFNRATVLSTVKCLDPCDFTFYGFNAPTNPCYNSRTQEDNLKIVIYTTSGRSNYSNFLLVGLTLGGYEINNANLIKDGNCIIDCVTPQILFGYQGVFEITATSTGTIVNSHFTKFNLMEMCNGILKC